MCPQTTDEPYSYNLTCHDDDDCSDGQWCCRTVYISDYGYTTGFGCVDPVASCAVSTGYNNNNITISHCLKFCLMNIYYSSNFYNSL